MAVPDLEVVNEMRDARVRARAKLEVNFLLGASGSRLGNWEATFKITRLCMISDLMRRKYCSSRLLSLYIKRFLRHSEGLMLSYGPAAVRSLLTQT